MMGELVVLRPAPTPDRASLASEAMVLIMEAPRDTIVEILGLLRSRELRPTGTLPGDGAAEGVHDHRPRLALELKK